MTGSLDLSATTGHLASSTSGWLNAKAGSIGGESPSLLLPASPASEEEDEARASRLYEGHTASQGHRVVLASAVSNCLGS